MLHYIDVRDILMSIGLVTSFLSISLIMFKVYMNNTIHNARGIYLHNKLKS